MSFKSSVIPELPFLRRYARAITGTQALGDAAVREVLEALLEAPDEFNSSNPPRAELYRAFHKLWQPAIKWGYGDNSPTSHLDAPTRQALMLTVLEGFSIAQTATILDVSVATVSEAVERATREISEQLVANILIIEDEPIIALHLKAIVTEQGHTVTSIARTHSEAVTSASRNPPQLVLADVSLADGSSGIEAAREILQSMTVPVIFVTAFPERLLTGERMEPTYLITKPFEAAVIVATIGQALMMHREAHPVLTT